MDRQLLLNIAEFELDAMSNNIFILYSYTLKKIASLYETKAF